MFPKRALKCCCHEVDRLAMCQGLNRKSAFTAFIATHSQAEEKRLGILLSSFSFKASAQSACQVRIPVICMLEHIALERARSWVRFPAQP